MKMRTSGPCRPVAVAVVLLMGAPAAPAAADLVDGLAAVVNGQPVTLVDVRIADAFGIYREEGDAGPADRLFRVLDLRNKVIQIELARHVAPAFADQTVDASKSEFVAQPRTIRTVVVVTVRAMTPCRRTWRVREWDWVTGCHVGSGVADAAA